MQTSQGVRPTARWIIAIALTSVGCSGTLANPDDSDEGTNTSIQSDARRAKHRRGSAGSTSSSAAGSRATGGSNAGGDANASQGGASSSSGGAPSSSGGAPSGSGESSGGAPSSGGSAAAAGGGSPTTGRLGLGSNSLTFTFTYSNVQKLDSKSIETAPGSTLLAVVGMGALANVHAPGDNYGNTFRELLPKHAYVNWWGSGQQIFAATNIAGGKNHVLTETMPDANDEVTLSVVEIRGAHSISAITVAETASKGPVTSANVTTKGPAMLVAWWWGDGAVVQTSATTSQGWTRLHSLSHAQAETGVIQTELAARAVDAAGTYSITWTSNPDQGAVVYLAAIE